MRRQPGDRTPEQAPLQAGRRPGSARPGTNGKITLVNAGSIFVQNDQSQTQIDRQFQQHDHLSQTVTTDGRCAEDR